MSMSEVDRRGAEQWFRRRGLPSVVRGLEDDLLVRIVPAVVWLALSDVLYDVLTAIDGDAAFETRLENDAFEALYTVTLAGSVVVPALGAWLAARWARDRVVRDRGFVTAVVVLAVYVLVWPVVDHVLADAEVFATIVAGLVQVAVLIGLTAIGVGSIVGWALRAAVRQLRGVGEMTSRAMPLLLLVTTFGFFTAEIWQIAGLVSRGRMWLVAGFFLVLSGLFLSSVFATELKALIAAARWPERVEALPVETFGGRTATEGAVPPLTRLERANMVLILLLTQLLQAMVFAILVFVVFAVLGKLAVPDGAIKAWVSHDPTPGKLFGVQVPMANELVGVCLFIAAFSGLYFVATIVTDAAHRKRFFDPVLEHLEVSLAGRALYLSHFGRMVP